jgi:hypothetical protein
MVEKQKSSTKYRYVGDHAEILDSGAPVGPGEYVELSGDQLEEPVTKALIDGGKLIDASDVKDEAQTKSATSTDDSSSTDDPKNEGSGE